MAYQRLLRQNKFKIKYYQKLLRYLIYAYFLVLLLQQFCVLSGLPIFNISNYNPLEPWKLNALAAEPSHSARIMALLMFCYITISELIRKRKYNFKTSIKRDKWVWLAFAWTMVTMGSGTAFLFIFIILLKFIRLKKLVPVVIIGLSLFFLIDHFELKAFDRTKNVFLATLTLDEEKIIEADHSASIRIVPFLILAKKIEIASWNGLFGNGIDKVGTFLYEFLPGITEGTTSGGILAHWFEYGFITFSLFIIFSFFAIYQTKNFFNIIFWFFLVFLGGINNQITWLCILLLFTNKYFFNQIKIIKLG